MPAAVLRPTEQRHVLLLKERASGERLVTGADYTYDDQLGHATQKPFKFTLPALRSR